MAWSLQRRFVRCNGASSTAICSLRKSLLRRLLAVVICGACWGGLRPVLSIRRNGRSHAQFGVGSLRVQRCEAKCEDSTEH